jgi:hypothetical protein
MKIGSSLSAVRSAIVSYARAPEEVRKELSASAPVVTISREAGTDAPAIVAELVRLLNEREPHQPWTAYDAELVHRVAEDHDLSARLVEAVEERDSSWIERFTAGLTGTPTDVEVAGKIAQTVRGICAVGRAVIVGRGGQAILRGLRHVTHVRLIAEEEWRAEHYPPVKDMEKSKALAEIRRIDNERRRFVRSRFNQDPDDWRLYHLTLNVTRIDAEHAAASIAALVE